MAFSGKRLVDWFKVILWQQTGNLESLVPGKSTGARAASISLA
jgi:hypothetical protein